MSDGINDYGGGSPGRPGGYDRDKSVSAPAQEVRPPISEAAQEMISLFENREELEKLLADHTSKCAELEHANAQNEFLERELSNFRRNATHRAEQLAAEKVAATEAELERVKLERDDVKEMLAKVQISSCDFDPETQKHETTHYQFEDVWHLGEAREKHRHGRTAEKLAKAESRLVAVGEQLKKIAAKTCQCISSHDDNGHHETCWKAMAIEALALVEGEKQ
jgi:hypothetical protein